MFMYIKYKCGPVDLNRQSFVILSSVCRSLCDLAQLLCQVVSQSMFSRLFVQECVKYFVSVFCSISGQVFCLSVGILSASRSVWVKMEGKRAPCGHGRSWSTRLGGLCSCLVAQGPDRGPDRSWSRSFPRLEVAGSSVWVTHP